ncbi:SusC/RagA family TonB-linked outer membrane protein, partial [Dysgonomonas sp. Marseille-P4677]|uniref:SusC/RagA family TonB-linked outer membrane protein n=1 Tax=Dysgonomonas sp. Marseille-P4677 TaxID=2364790 RepID=UPI0019116602
MLKKLTLIVCCSLTIFILPIKAQQTVNLNMKDVSLETLIKTIEKTTNYTFMFDNTLDLSEKVNVNYKDTSIKTALDKVFQGKGIIYEISGNQIVLRKEEQGISQNRPLQKVTGTVIDKDGFALIGVTVKGGDQGTVTDVDGKFEISVPKGTNITFSYIGFSNQEVKASDSPLRVLMHEDNTLLSEVVVVGYGTMEKRAVTSSITSLSSKDLVQGVGGASIATALQGKVSGLVISGTSSPNSSNEIQLRGVGSINAGQQPLVVIDGIPGGDIRSVNQEDILSIDVLKDASAGAIYGTRAAAGVILITTKQGQSTDEGRIKFTYTGEFTTESIRKKPEVLSAQEYLEYNRGKDYGGDTNWYDELTKDLPFSHRQVFNVTGGTKYSNVYATFTTQDQKGVVINDSRKDYSARINANFKFIDNFLELKTHAAYRQAKRTNHQPNFNQALKSNPTRPAYNPNDPSNTGYNIWLGGWEDFNALAESNLKNNGGLDKWLNGDVTIKLNFTPEFSFQTTIGYQNRQWDFHEYTSRWTKEMQEAKRTGRAKLGIDKRDDVSLDSYANYIKDFNGHSINATAGYSFFETNREKWDMTNFNFPVDAIDVWDMNAGTYLSDGEAEMSSSKDARERLIAFFGRANYSYKDKYMVTASLRHEGSSKFGKNNRWGDFWSLSGGWRISEESFMENLSFINDLKLRVGYGITGNNGFSAGKSTLMYGSDQWWFINNEWVRTFGSTHNVNPDLKWEEKKELNFGLDYSLFNNRLYGKLDVYKRKVDGMLYNINVPQPPYVHYDMIVNA